MADVKGVNYTNYDSSPRAMVESAQWGGRMRVMYDTYTATAALGTGSTIKVGRLPKNATFHAGYVITSKSLDLQSIRLKSAQPKWLRHELILMLCLTSVVW